MNDQEETYGTGEQIVESPDQPDQLEKENPKDQLPQKVVDQKSGKVLDLDSGEISKPEIIEVDGMKIDVSEFGDGGVYWLMTMYEQWLIAVQTDQESTFCGSDEDGVNSALIIEIYRVNHYPHEYLKMLKNRTRVISTDDAGNEIKRAEQFIAWNRDTTLEQWMAWTAATLRWRIDYEFSDRETRRIGERISGLPDMREACENCLIAAEKFLASSDQRRLTAI